MTSDYQAAVSGLATATRIEQLERIDKLRELGLGDDIKLPQVRPSTSLLMRPEAVTDFLRISAGSGR